MYMANQNKLCRFLKDIKLHVYFTRGNGIWIYHLVKQAMVFTKITGNFSVLPDGLF